MLNLFIALAASPGLVYALSSPALPLSSLLIRWLGLSVGLFVGLQIANNILPRLVAILPIAKLSESYRQNIAWAHLPLLLTNAAFFGIQPAIPTIQILLLVLLASHITLLALLTKTSTELSEQDAQQSTLLLLFFVSGFAALIYQVCWQRVLFRAYGVNIESITIIVSIFMFGLGIGSLVGGYLSKRFPNRLPQLFILCEVAIGVFGIFSLSIIQTVSDAVVVNGSITSISVSVYLLLALPTMMMGATLPLLVAHVHQQSKNLGQSLGLLYAINTIGSGIASIVTVDVLFVFMNLNHAVAVAAACNILVAVGAYWYMSSSERAATVETDSNEKTSPPFPSSFAIPVRSALIISFLIGFISLSQEMLWTRSISFATSSLPQIFGHILGFFLFGVAFGSLLAKDLCRRNLAHPYLLIAALCAVSSVFYWLSLPVIAQVMVRSASAGIVTSYLFVSLIAFFLGGVLVILTHYAVSTRGAVGQGLSWIYIANILGSTAGPLITGFILLDSMTVETLVFAVSGFGLILAGVLCVPAMKLESFPRFLAGGSLAALAMIFVAHGPLYDQLLVDFLRKTEFSSMNMHTLIQNRSGIIAVTEKDGIYTTYGGGAYDGTIHWDPDGYFGKEQYSTLYDIAKFHPEPKSLLFIGMSSGTGAKLLADYQTLEKIDLIEINPGYVDLLKIFPNSDALFNDDRIKIHLDDGRRWLVRNPSEKFDVIVNATSHHFRSHMTNINSVEFFTLCRERLNQGGILFFHATNSEDVALTMSQVFPYVVEEGGYAIASLQPFVLEPETAQENYRKFVFQGKPVFFNEDGSIKEEHRDRVLGTPPYSKGWHDAAVITDGNMLGEFKRGNAWISKFYRMYNEDKTLMAH